MYFWHFIRDGPYLPIEPKYKALLRSNQLFNFDLGQKSDPSQFSFIPIWKHGLDSHLKLKNLKKNQ